MKNLFNNIYFFVLFLFFNAVGYAQLYPVQLTPVFNSPYSVKISDYATSMDTKMQLLINPTDISISQRRVRLKLYIQGNGLNIQTSDYAIEQRPIYINGGELQTLTNVDIASLFRLENLQGITPAQYANPLPEGMYNFCFEMYDFATNQKISQKSCANLYLILNDPPLLNTPQKNEQIASTEFPNILFTWTPRQINATNISYKFELKQLLDPTLDPQIGFQMSPTLYEETLYGTAILYNLSMPILTPGLRYAWRVRAISTTGLSENSVFKNDGYSEIYSFKYTAACAAPIFLLSEAQSSKSVKITWEGIPEHTRYQVQYKKQDVRNAQWFSSNSLNRQSLITNLEPGVTYEFRVGSSCDPAEDGVQSFTYSNSSTFTTPTETNGVPAYNCGIVPQINIQNQKPLTNLIQSETFKAGDFPVTILELQGQNSPYSGRGYIIVPYLADTKIAVEFKDIVINTDYQLISGVVETSYNPDWKNVTDVEDFTGEGKGGQIEEKVPFVIKDIVINANGDIVVNGENGEQITIPGGKDTVITDSGVVDESGKVIVPPKVYTVDSQGNGSNQGVAVAEGGKPSPENTDGVDKSGQATGFTAKGVSIAFSGNGSKYAFDVMPDNASAALKKMYAKAGDNILPYKAVLNGDSDTVIATVKLTDANIKLDSIVFKTQNGAKIDFKRTDNVFVLTVKGNLSYAEEEILATVKQGKKWQVIGAFMLVHISPKDVNVALVPTYDNSENRLNEIVAKTQEIYSKIGVKINFNKEGKLKDFEDVVSKDVSVIQTENNTITSTYSAQQQAINALYKGGSGSYVLFVTNKTSSTKQEGYMRLNGQFGYVFTKANGQENPNTAAHELGHGIFKLQHPFEQYKTEEGSTDFLMDYSSGSVLNHMDWKQINDPAFKLYAFQSQSSGEKVDKEFVLKEDGYFLTPANKLIKLPKGTEIIFTCDQPQSINNGALYSFKTPDGIYWHSTLNPNKGVTETSFKGYFKATADGWIKDNGKLITYSDSNFKYNSVGKYAVYIINMLSIDNQKKEYRILNQEMQLSAQQISTTNSFSGNIVKLTYEGNNGLIEIISSTGCSSKPDEEGSNNIAEISYKDYLTGLGKIANKGYKEDLLDVNASESHMYDYSGVISEKEKLKVFNQLQNISSESGLVTKIFITDAETLPTKKKEVTDHLASLSGSQIALWVDFDSSGKATVKTILGKGVNGNGNKDVSRFLALLSQVIPKFDGTYTYFNPFTAVLDAVADIVTKAKIPERFFNPEITTKDYNPILFYASLADPFAWTLLINDQALAAMNISITDSKLVNMNHIYFAFKCGMWNGLVDQVKGLVEIAAIVTNLIDGGDRAAEMWEGLKKLGVFCTATTEQEVCIWSLIKKSHTGQVCQIVETVGYDVANIITIAASFTKAGKLAQISQVMESLDALNLLMKAAGKLIRVTVKASGTALKFSYAVGKAFIVPGLKLAKGGMPFCVVFPIVIDLTENIDNAVSKAKELLKKTPAEIDRELIILSPPDVNGNIIAEIVENGKKTKVLLNENEDKLRKSVDELIEEASEALLARLKKLGLTEDEINNVLDKIGNSLDNTNKLTNILEKAPFKDDVAKLKSFLSDISKSADLQDFIRQGKDFTREWDFFNRAGRDIKLRGSKEAIESLSDILNDPSMKRILGSEMDDIIEKFIIAHKNPEWGWNKFAFQEHMRMLKVIANRYEGIQGFNKSLRDALNNPLSSMQDGLWHMMKDLEKRGIPREKIKAFDLEFDADDLPCLKCKFDVELNSTGNELKYLEYKSYKNASKISKQQFLNYISMVDNLEQLQYVFNKSKLSLDEIKAGMKEFLINNSENMFKAVNQGGIGKDKVKQLFEFGNFKFDNATEFKNLLEKNESFRENALKFVKTN